MAQELHVRNWSKWQSYRSDRGQPPWIKVHRQLLRDPNFVRLTDTQRGHLMVMWILAADREGQLPSDPAMIRKLCYMDQEPNLQVYVSLGFLEWRQDDVTVTPGRRQADTLARSREAEAETEEETETATTAAAPPESVVDNSGTGLPLATIRPAYTNAELLEAANTRLGLGRLSGLDLQANGRILLAWLYGKPPRDPGEILDAIEGAAAMRDADLIGWDSAKPGTPMTLKALNGPMTLADQGDGQTVRDLYAVAVEYSRRPAPPPTAKRTLTQPSRLRTSVPHETQGVA